MLTQQTLTRLRSLKLDGMAHAFEEQLAQPAAHGLAFEERFGLLVDREVAWRDTRRVDRLLKLTGATGVGKTWLACALAQQAARSGFSALYMRAPRLLEELRIAHGDGSFGGRLAQLAKIDVLILDDWALAPISAAERCDLLEVLDDRVSGKATIITSQLPVKHWHEYLAEPTIADAIIDRIVHRSHRLELDGDSLRKDPPVKGARKS